LIVDLTMNNLKNYSVPSLTLSEKHWSDLFRIKMKPLSKEIFKIKTSHAPEQSTTSAQKFMKIESSPVVQTWNLLSSMRECDLVWALGVIFSQVATSITAGRVTGGEAPSDEAAVDTSENSVSFDPFRLCVSVSDRESTRSRTARSVPHGDGGRPRSSTDSRSSGIPGHRLQGEPG
jgi:hypothetical protein